MRYEKTQPQELQEPEVVLNLWAYAGEDGYVMRLSAKAYVMQGGDKYKLSLLHDLSSTDFLSTAWRKVPKNFTMNGADGEEMKGVAHASMLADETTHGHLFGSLMEEITENLPMQIRSLGGEYIEFKLDLPQSPLTVTTLVMEYEDGRCISFQNPCRNTIPASERGGWAMRWEKFKQCPNRRLKQRLAT